MAKILATTGHFHFSHRMPALLAKQLGYFEQEGLLNSDIEIMATGEDEFTVVGLKNGKISIGLDLKPNVVFRENSKGVRVYIIAGMLNRVPFSFIGAKGMKSIQDLKGKRIGNTESGGGISTPLIKAALKQGGLDPERDVTYVLHHAFPSLSDQSLRLDRGDYEAAVILHLYTSQAAAAGYPILSDMTKLYPEGFPNRVIVTTGGMLEQWPQTVMGFLRGMIRAYRFGADRRNHGVISTFIERYNWEKNFGFDSFDESLLETQFPAFAHTPLDGLPSKKGLEVLIEEGKLAGRLPSNYSLSNVIRLQFVEEAAKDIDLRHGPEGY